MKKKLYLLPALVWFAVSCTYAQNNNSTNNNQQTLRDFDYQKPIFKLEGKQLSNKSRFLRFSVLTGYREGVELIKKENGMRLGIYNDPDIGTSRISMLNQSIQDMLALGLSPAQMLFEVKDISKYRYDAKYGNEQEWMLKNGWCYEFVLPMRAFPTRAILDFVRNDIAGQFNLKIIKEKRMTDDQHRYGLDAGQPNREVEILVIMERNQ